MRGRRDLDALGAGPSQRRQAHLRRVQSGASRRTSSRRSWERLESRLPFSEMRWMKRRRRRAVPVDRAARRPTRRRSTCASTWRVCRRRRAVLSRRATSSSGSSWSPTRRRSYRPDNSNPDNCAWLLNMYGWAAAQPRVPAYGACAAGASAARDAARRRWAIFRRRSAGRQRSRLSTVDMILASVTRWIRTRRGWQHGTWRLPRCTGSRVFWPAGRGSDHASSAIAADFDVRRWRPGRRCPHRDAPRFECASN